MFRFPLQISPTEKPLFGWMIFSTNSEPLLDTKSRYMVQNLNKIFYIVDVL